MSLGQKNNLDVQIKESLGKDELPNNEKILSAVRAGKFSIDDMKAKYSQYKASSAAVAQSPSPIPVQAADQAIQQGNNAIQIEDRTIQSYIEADELPNNPAIIDSITSGEFTLDQMKQKYQEYKAGQGIITIDQQNRVNKAEDLKIEAKKDSTFGERLAASYQNVVNQNKFIASKWAEGATFGIYENEIEAPDKVTAITGTIASFVGGIQSGIASSAVTGAIPGVAKLGTLIKGSDEAIAATKFLGKNVSFGMRAAKYGLEAGKIAAEAAPLGLAVEGTKSLLRGNEMGDAVVDALTGAAQYTVFGLALQPIMGGIGALIDRSGSKRAAASLGKMQADETVQSIAKNTGPEKLDAAITTLKSKPNLTSDDLSQINVLEKIKILQPKFDGDLPTAILNNPEAVKGLTKVEMQRMADETFLNPEASFRAIYEGNSALKKLVDTGQYPEAFASLTSILASEVKKNPDVVDYMVGPLKANAKLVADTMGERIVARTNPEKLGSYTPELFTNYALNPNKENQILLKQSLADKKIFGRIKKSAASVNDMRLRPEEVGPFTEKLITDHFQNISGSTIPFNKIGFLKDTDGIITAAVTHNRDLHRTIIQAAQRELSPSYMTADPEIQPFVQDAMRLRGLIEENGAAIKAKNKVTLNIRAIQQKLRTATGAEKQSLRSQLSIEKHNLGIMTGKIGYEGRQIAAINSKLDSLGPELRGKTESFAAKSWLPTKSQEAGMVRALEGGDSLRSVTKTVTGESSTAEVFGKYGSRNNPQYIAADSDLADALTAMAVVGKELDLKPYKLFGKDLFGGPARSLRRQMGPGNAIEIGVVDRYRSLEVARAADRKNYIAKMKTSGVKYDSPEDLMATAFGEGTMNKTSPEFLALSPASQDQVLRTVNTGKQIYNELIDRINGSMRRMNWPEVSKRDNYVPHLVDLMDSFPTMLRAMMGGPDAQAALKAMDSEAMPFTLRQVFDKGKTNFKFEYRRTGTPNYGKSYMRAFDKYLDPALDRIHFTEMLRDVDVSRDFATQGVGEWLNKFKNQVLLKESNIVQSETEGWVKKGADWFASRRGKSMVKGSLNFVYQQMTSAPLAFAFAGRDALTSIPKMFTAEGKAVMARSKNLAIRDIMDFAGTTSAERMFKRNVIAKLPAGGVINKVLDGKEYLNNMMRYGASLFDSMAAGFAHVAMHTKGKRMGLDDDAAAKLADWATAKVHSSVSRVDRPEVFNSSLGRLKSQFQSFTMNLAATLVQDLPQIAAREGAAASVVTLLRGYAAVSLTNEIMAASGLPKPFSPNTFIPFVGGHRFGTDVNVSKIIDDAAKGELGPDSFSKLAIDLGVAMSGPGALQVSKSVSALKADQKGEIPQGHLGRAMVFGKTQAKKISNETLKRRNALRKRQFLER